MFMLVLFIRSVSGRRTNDHYFTNTECCAMGLIQRLALRLIPLFHPVFKGFKICLTCKTCQNLLSYPFRFVFLSLQTQPV